MADEASGVTTSFLLKDIPKDLWRDVKGYVFDQEPKMTLQDFLLQAAREKLTNERASR